MRELSSALRRGAFELRDYEHCLISGVCGNKARKLAGLSVPAGGCVSHGGPQSNAMLALAHLCEARGSALTYHTKPLPGWLRRSPSGNLGLALSLGMTLIEHRSAAEYEAAVAKAAEAGCADGVCFVPRGGACADAEPGVASLARQIGEWRDRRPTPSPLDVVVPSGTGTTALYLARHAPAGVRVLAVPCVGSSGYLTEQMVGLDDASGGHGRLPTVLSPPASHCIPFGSLSRSLLGSWREAARHGVLLDLVYGPVAWSALASRGWSVDGGRAALAGDGRAAGGDGRELLYLNCGGHEGLPSQLRRYARAGMLAEGEDADAALLAAQRASGVWLEPEPLAARPAPT